MNRIESPSKLLDASRFDERSFLGCFGARTALGLRTKKLQIKSSKPAPMGVGGLNLWDLGGRYRTGCHTQIFFTPGNFDYFSGNQRIQTAAARFIEANQGLVAAERVFIDIASSQRNFFQQNNCREIRGGGRGR